MKQFILYISIFISSISVSFAQPGGNDGQKGQKAQALYIAYITRELNLTEDEAKSFWPVHSLYDAEIKTANMNENELERQQQALNIKKKYQDRFIKVLGVDRTNNFFKIDAGFRDKMLEVLRKRRQQGKGNGYLRQKMLLQQ
jgi:hypothetical protein